MRLGRRHAWGGLLVVLFALPVWKPEGIGFVERPIGAFTQWFAEVPGVNPRLLGGPGSVAADAGGISSQHDREMTRLWNHVFRVRERMEQIGGLARVLGADSLERMPRVRLCRVLRAHDPVSWRRSFLIDAGSAEGLGEGQPVVVDGVYCGRVAVVWRHTALVRLVTDPQARIEVFVRTNSGRLARGWARRRGTLEGRDALHVEFVRLAPEDGGLSVGAAVLTANFDERVPAELLVGRVAEIEDAERDAMPTLRVRPELDAGAVTEVVVLMTESHAPR